MFNVTVKDYRRFTDRQGEKGTEKDCCRKKEEQDGDNLNCQV